MTAVVSRGDRLKSLAAAFNEVAARLERIDGDDASAHNQLKHAMAHAGKLAKKGDALGVFPWLKIHHQRFGAVAETAEIDLNAQVWRIFVVEWLRLAPDVSPNDPLARRPAVYGAKDQRAFVESAADWRIRRENSAQICRQVARMLEVSSPAKHGELPSDHDADTQRKIAVVNQTKDPLTKALLVARLDGAEKGKTEAEIHDEFKKTYRRQLGNRDSDRERMFANKARNVRRRLEKLNGVE